MSDRATLGALLQALAQTRPDATVADFDQAARPEAYAVPMDRRPATLRAPTYRERLMDVVQRLAQPVAEQPVGRILDILLSGGGVRAIADGQSPPLVSMGEAQRKRVPNPIKAYHGSPHDFGRVGGQGADAGGFDINKIGTGEGAQAFGHGLYFAEAEPTARTYRVDRSDIGRQMAGQASANGPWTPQRIAQDAVDEHGDKAVAHLESVLRATAGLKSKGQAESNADVRAAMDLIRSNAVSQRGRMYEVNIHADPESFLDWDKPLSQQSEAVRKAAEKFGVTHDRDASRQFTDALADALGGGGSTTLPKQPADPMGSDLYSRLPIPDRTKSAVSERLRAEGIPGIKYLDQGSRAAGEGSRNYVVFDDSLIEILRKYGLLPFAAGLGAAGKDQR